MGNQSFYGTGVSVPVSQNSADLALGAAIAVGTSIYTYRDQQASLNKYDKALGIDVNLPKDVRKQMRDKAFRDQGEKPPSTAARAVVNLWVWVILAGIVIMGIAAMIEGAL